MFRQTVIALASAAAFGVGFTGSAEAATITPLAVEASSTFFTYDKEDLINNSGLSGGFHSNDFRDMWMNKFAGPSGILTFDLGGVYNLSGASIWQYNAGLGLSRGVRAFEVLTSLDGNNFSFLGVKTLNQAVGSPAEAAQFVVFNETAKYVRFNILSNWGDSAYTGLSEVKFEGEMTPESVPTPALLPGLIGLGVTALRKKSRKEEFVGQEA